MTWTNPDYVDDTKYNPEPEEEQMSDTTTETPSIAAELLTEEEIAVLADCRRTLKEIIKRDTNLSYDPRVKQGVGSKPSGTDMGRLLAMLDHAENSIFMAMSVAHAYCGVQIADDEMYAR